MKNKIVVTGQTLDIALMKVAENYNIPKEQIQYTLRKDAKSGVFGIIPPRDAEIEVLLPMPSQHENDTDKKNVAKRDKKSGKQILEEELIPFVELSLSDREIALAMIQEVIATIVTTVSKVASIQTHVEQGSIYIHIEENQDTKVLIGKDLEVLKAIQYLLYKIITQHMRCFFSLHISLGDVLVSEETLLVSMVAKLIEKVKTTHKNQRTYPLNAEQRAIVHNMIEEEPTVGVKKQKSNLPLQPVILIYTGQQQE